MIWKGKDILNLNLKYEKHFFLNKFNGLNTLMFCACKIAKSGMIL
jgi:hypothetical protein